MQAPEEIIYDGDYEAKGSKYFSYITALSLNQDKLAIGKDKTGNEEYLVVVRDIKTKKILTKHPIKTSSNFFFAKNDWLYYTILSEERRPFQLKRHTLGDDPKNDIIIYTVVANIMSQIFGGVEAAENIHTIYSHNTSFESISDPKCTTELFDVHSPPLTF